MRRRDNTPLRERIYAVYEGEDNIMDGTIDEICARRGVKFSTVAMMVSDSYAKRMSQHKQRKSHKRLEYIRIDNIEEDWDNDELSVPAVSEDIHVQEP